MGNIYNIKFSQCFDYFVNADNIDEALDLAKEQFEQDIASGELNTLQYDINLEYLDRDKMS